MNCDTPSAPMPRRASGSDTWIIYCGNWDSEWGPLSSIGVATGDFLLYAMACVFVTNVQWGVFAAAATSIYRQVEIRVRAI